jgi:PAS domain S-box-containing protein
MNSPLRVLHLEDDVRDRELVQAALEAEGIPVELTRVETEQDFVATLHRGGSDVILADYTLPSFDGLSALRIAQQQVPNVPFLFVSGTLGEDVAIEALKTGATDYVLKTRLSRLGPAVTRALREARDRTERKRAEDGLRRSEAYLAEAQRLSQTGSFGWDVSSGEIYWSRETFRIFGYEPAAKVTIAQVMRRTHPQDKSAVQQLIERVTRERKEFDFEHRLLMPDGAVKFIRAVGHPSIDESGNFEFVGAVTDITERKRGETLFAGEKRLLEMIATGVALKEILNCLCLIIEEYRSGTFASVLLLQPDGIHLDSVAGPSLPKGWAQQMEKLPIGPCAGSCGTAAYRGSAVIVSDIATDPLWDVPEHRAAALSHGLHSSWSNPILSSEGKVLGTFCLYGREPRSPTSQDLGVIGKATDLARVAIERDRAEEALRRNETHLAEAQTLSKTGSWVWNAKTRENVFWSKQLRRIYGFDPETSVVPYAAARERVHPEDGTFFNETFDRALRERRDFEMDHRIVLPGGEVKHIHVVGHPVLNGSGELVEYIGTVMDLTAIKRAADAVRASEQVARGQVEALAHSLDVLATAPDPEKFIGQMLSTIGRLLNAQNVSLWLFNESDESLLMRSMVEDGELIAPDPTRPFAMDPYFWKHMPIVQELLFTAGPVVCDDWETDPRVTGEWRDYLKRKGARKFMTVPILMSGKVRGFVAVRHGDRASYRPEEVELTQALAHQVMLAIQLNEFAEQGRRAAVLEERNRMARDIHDTLAQGFTGVIVQLEAAEDAVSCGSRKDADQHLHRAGELARRSLSEARRSVHALRPHALEEHNFWEALKGTIKNTTVGTALRTTFEAQGKLPELSQPWQANLLHIGQEALTNTLKYAHARNFKTRLTYKAKALRLELRDDGNGFKAKDRHDGVGLSGMRERVQQMGGELEITSSRRKGTKITVLLPCNGESIS